MISISRRTKFLTASILYLFGILLFDYIQIDKFNFLILGLFIVFIINTVALYPGFKIKDLLIISYLPLVTFASTILGLIFFPNLSSLFKYLLMFSSGGIVYLSFLINNLIIAEKVEDESLPLFRVGQIWLQILLITLSIPLVTVIYKFNLPFYLHSLVIFVYLIFSSYVYLHTYMLSKNSQIGRREYLFLIFQMSILPFAASIATSFVSAESFFRATFVTSVYISMVSFARNYVDSTLSQKLMIQYLLICSFFLFVLVVFKP